jgi:HD-like signal output (HDOD) protein
MLKRLFSSSGPDIRRVPATLGNLRRLKIFSHLANDELILLANKLQQRQLKPGEQLFQIGENEAEEFFLLQGRLKIIGMDRSERILDGRSAKAQELFCALRPRQFTATALDDCVCLEIERPVLEGILAGRPQPEDGAGAARAGGSVQAAASGGGSSDAALAVELEEDEAALLEASFNRDLSQNRFVLTSLPEVALKVRKVLEDPEFTTDQVTEVINTDPVIAAKLIKATNSPLYRTWGACDSTSEAVIRLGVTTTRQLVMNFTMKDLFKAEAPALKNAMREAWRHTVFHSAIAWVMARETGNFSPEEAMTAAMLSNIGVLTVCSYLENYPDVYQDVEAREATIAHLKAPVGAQILEKWGLSEQLQECARHSEHWQRGHDGQPDLCDLVIVSALHAHLGHRMVPKFDQVPAFQRLCSAQLLDPEKALDFLETAADQVSEARALLEF